MSSTMYTQKYLKEKDSNYSYLENYQILRKIGDGFSSKVKLGINLEDNKFYAIKIFKQSYYEEYKDTRFSTEYEIMKSVNHTSLIKFKELKKDATYFRKKHGS